MKHPWLWALVVPRALKRLLPRVLLESPLLVAARHPWLALGALAIAAAIGGLAVAASGVMPITASSGHWPITRWLLQFSKHQSVATHAATITAPPLDDPQLVLRGAGAYETGCRACHGAAGSRPMIPLAMTPEPPDLWRTAPNWLPRELFYLVKHGIKFTGMPAWPALQRDDEVWAMVAFLRRAPQLDLNAYRALVDPQPLGVSALGAEETLTTEGSAAAPAVETDVPPSPQPPADRGRVGPAPSRPPDVVADTCARCHGADGQGRGPRAFPKLAGQSEEYLRRALDAYADERRHSGMMGPIARALPRTVRAEVAAYYAAQPAAPAPADSAAAVRGRTLAMDGAPDRKIPSCMDCHGPDGASKQPAYPRLTGQYADYLVQQLELLQHRQRGGSEFVHLMHSFVDRLTAEDIQNVSAYYAAQ